MTATVTYRSPEASRAGVAPRELESRLGRDDEEAIMLRERVTVADFESRHFGDQLVQRLGWAVSDANAVEQAQPEQVESSPSQS